MVGRIDELCDVYERPIIITQAVYNLVSYKAQEFCRRIDLIMMKECPTTEQVEIYSFDHYPSENLDMDEFDPETHKLGEFIRHSDFEN